MDGWETTFLLARPTLGAMLVLGSVFPSYRIVEGWGTFVYQHHICVWYQISYTYRIHIYLQNPHYKEINKLGRLEIATRTASGTACFQIILINRTVHECVRRFCLTLGRYNINHHDTRHEIICHHKLRGFGMTWSPYRLLCAGPTYSCGTKHAQSQHRLCEEWT